MTRPTQIRPLPTMEEQAFILKAARFLEHPSLLIRMTDLLGKPLDFVQDRLPPHLKHKVSRAVEKSLHQALQLSLSTLPKAAVGKDWENSIVTSRQSGRWHTTATGLTGAVGGFFGLMSLPLELPITTTIMLRSIASTAQAYGGDLTRPEIQLECLYVFTLGSHSKADDEMDSAYFSSRLMFGRMIHQASRFVATHSHKEILQAVEKGAAPGLVRFIAQVASRFEMAVSEKVLAESVPVIGAFGGAAINAAFTDYFNKAAHFHFGIKRLEALYGRETVLKIYTSKDTKRTYSA